MAVLAESHISIHTWPESGYAALDVFMCGKADPDACVPVLREAFKAKRVAVERDAARARDCSDGAQAIDDMPAAGRLCPAVCL